MWTVPHVRYLRNSESDSATGAVSAIGPVHKSTKQSCWIRRRCERKGPVGYSANSYQTRSNAEDNAESGTMAAIPVLVCESKPGLMTSPVLLFIYPPRASPSSEVDRVTITPLHNIARLIAWAALGRTRVAQPFSTGVDLPSQTTNSTILLAIACE